MLVTQGLLGIGGGISGEQNGVWEAIEFLLMTQKGKWALLREYLWSHQCEDRLELGNSSA